MVDGIVAANGLEAGEAWRIRRQLGEAVGRETDGPWSEEAA